MTAQSFKCPKCQKYTRHVPISYLEYESHYYNVKFKEVGYSRTETIFGKAMGTLADVTGLGLAFKKIVGVAPYKCCECGSIHKWNAEGEWIE